jgi:hypothetical protein
METGMNRKELERVSSLMKELLNIIRKEGGEGEEYAAKELERCIGYIKETIDDVNADSNEVFTRVKNLYRSMYPPHGGMTDFFVWRDDFDERIAANRRLDAVKAELGEIFDM